MVSKRVPDSARSLREKWDWVERILYCPAQAPATFSTETLRRNSAAASGSTVLMNIPDPSSNPATRVSRGITLTYQ